jgi:hypothetical protein
VKKRSIKQLYQGRNINSTEDRSANKKIKYWIIMTLNLAKWL